MIKATELRIGNTLYFLIKNENGGKVTGRLISNLTGAQICKISEMENVSDFWESIPITPEILEKAGFIKTDVQGEYINCHRGILHVCFDRIGLISYRIGDMNFTTVHYVHQLQNLFFFLTGEELEINLNHTTLSQLH